MIFNFIVFTNWIIACLIKKSNILRLMESTSHGGFVGGGVAIFLEKDTHFFHIITKLKH
jgi:hypothetical protein